MSGNNNFNFFGPSQDPLLSPEYMDTQIEKMIEMRDQMRKQQAQAQSQQHQPAQKTVWDDITEELNSMSDAQKEILFQDDEYRQCDEEIAIVAAKYQMSLLMPYVLEDAEGKKSLERQLCLIRAKKEKIIKQERSEMEEFRRWKEETKSKPSSK